MSGFKINFNDLKRELEKQVQPALNSLGRQLEQELASLHRTHVGRPLPEVKAAVKHAVEKIGGRVTDPELTEYATAIQTGQQIKINVEKVRF